MSVTGCVVVLPGPAWSSTRSGDTSTETCAAAGSAKASGDGEESDRERAYGCGASSHGELNVKVIVWV